MRRPGGRWRPPRRLCVWSPVTDALRGAGRLLAQSVGGLISFVVAVSPWTLVLAALGWAVRAVWRRRRRPA